MKSWLSLFILFTDETAVGLLTERPKLSSLLWQINSFTFRSIFSTRCSVSNQTESSLLTVEMWSFLCYCSVWEEPSAVSTFVLHNVFQSNSSEVLQQIAGLSTTKLCCIERSKLLNSFFGSRWNRTVIRCAEQQKTYFKDWDRKFVIHLFYYLA